MPQEIRKGMYTPSAPGSDYVFVPPERKPDRPPPCGWAGCRRGAVYNVRIMMASGTCIHTPRETCNDHLAKTCALALSCPEYPYGALVVETVPFNPPHGRAQVEAR